MLTRLHNNGWYKRTTELVYFYAFDNLIQFLYHGSFLGIDVKLEQTTVDITKLFAKLQNN